MTIEEFKNYFSRDFTYGDTLPDILDADIQKAIDEALLVFNNDLYPESVKPTALLYLVAHYLKINIDSADMGGQSNFIMNSRSAAGISASLNIPEWMNIGECAFFATTYYGQRFLMITKPYLDGVILTVQGMTQY